MTAFVVIVVVVLDRRLRHLLQSKTPYGGDNTPKNSRSKFSQSTHFPFWVGNSNIFDDFICKGVNGMNFNSNHILWRRLKAYLHIKAIHRSKERRDKSVFHTKLGKFPMHCCLVRHFDAFPRKKERVFPSSLTCRTS